MTRMQNWLKDHDPVAVEPPLDVDETRRLRRTLINHVSERAPLSPSWRPIAWAGVVVAVVLIGVTGISPTSDTTTPALAPASVDARAQAPATRQLQFSTPGGTRVIWVFNPAFIE